VDLADLYGRYSQDVFRFALYLTGSRDLAEEITAETFARALTAAGDVRAGSIKAYLLAIARNLFLDWTRRQGRTTSLSSTDLEFVDSAPNPEDAAAGRLELEAVQQSLLQLPEGERAALLMAAVEGLPYDQIGAALGCSVAAVKVRIHRARVRLRLLGFTRSARS
jgi:RNA polymerase sigma-70 factor, ECF subfamily